MAAAAASYRHRSLRYFSPAPRRERFFMTMAQHRAVCTHPRATRTQPGTAFFREARISVDIIIYISVPFPAPN